MRTVNKGDAPTLVPLGLAGGQGKTTVGLMLARILAMYEIPVLLVDADPQSSLTAFLGVEVQEDRPTLLEVITNPKLPVFSAIQPVPSSDNLFVIPTNDQLEAANHHLAASAMSLQVLRNRLYQVGEKVDPSDRIAVNFGIIIVDPPPERSHLALTSLGAGDLWVVPAEANVKGVQSLVRTKELIESYEAMLPNSEFIGVIPFRAKWVGRNPTATTKNSIQVMEEIVGPERMLPHILESDVYKRAINDQVLPSFLGDPELEYAFKVLIQRIKPRLAPAYQKLLPKKL